MEDLTGPGFQLNISGPTYRRSTNQPLESIRDRALKNHHGWGMEAGVTGTGRNESIKVIIIQLIHWFWASTPGQLIYFSAKLTSSSEFGVTPYKSSLRRGRGALKTAGNSTFRAKCNSAHRQQTNCDKMWSCWLI